MNEKTQWVELQVTMPLEVRNTIHACHEVLGTRASGWAREILLERLPELAARAEQRKRKIQALFTHGKSVGSPPPARRVNEGHAVRTGKTRKTVQGRKAKA